VAVDSTSTSNHGCAAGKTRKSECGCLVPAPGGWAPAPWEAAPRQGNRSGYSWAPGDAPNGYAPNGSDPAGYPSPYPNTGYPNGYGNANDPSGYYPPNTGYSPASGNPCVTGNGLAGAPVVDSSGRVFCRATASNTAPGAGLNRTGW
jgi:hypothetical protein